MKLFTPVIDLHCDTITECHKQELSLNSRNLAFSLAKLPGDFRLCQCMAVWMPDELRGEDAVMYFDAVYKTFAAQMKRFDEVITPLDDVTAIEKNLEHKRFSAILTVEGGSALAGRLENVSRLYDMGVRMMTLTWNAANEICGGANTNLGFTPFGRRVVAEMEQLKMVVDVSHLSDKGFFELCEFAAVPFIASHSNSREVCCNRRNLTDEMFTEIVKRGGLTGLNYYKSFVRDDGENGCVDDLLRHVHHFLGLGGENALALGSDFDGAEVPPYINGVDKLGFLAEAMEKSGISSKIVEKILFDNANRYFKALGNCETRGIAGRRTRPLQ